MKAKIQRSILSGIIKAVPSKSYLHRYILACSMANGKSSIYFDTKILSDDIKATLSCILELGSKYEIYDDHIDIYGIIKKEGRVKLDVLESGSTLRFIIPIALRYYDDIYIKVGKRLIERGIGAYLPLFDENNVKYEIKEDEIFLKGNFNKEYYKIDASKSSQYVTGMLYNLALLNKRSILEIETTLSSRPYIDITLDVLRRCGINVKKDENKFIIEQSSFNAGTYFIEGDYSNSAFVDAYNYFQSNVEIEGLNPYSYQGDKVYKKFFNVLNTDYFEIDIANCIDLGPILFTFAALKHGAKFTSCKRLLLKESNRLDDMLAELAKIGVRYKVLDRNDTVIIERTDISKVGNVTFDSHNDHRLAMALVLILSLTGGVLLNASAVNKSYPNFFTDLEALGLNVEME